MPAKNLFTKKAIGASFLTFFRKNYFLIFVGFLIIATGAIAGFYYYFLLQLEGKEPVVHTPQFPTHGVVELHELIEQREAYREQIEELEYPDIFQEQE